MIIISFILLFLFLAVLYMYIFDFFVNDEARVSVVYQGYFKFIFLLLFMITYVFVFGFFVKDFSLIESFLEFGMFDDSFNAYIFYRIGIMSSMLIFISFIFDRCVGKNYLKSVWLILIIPAAINVVCLGFVAAFTSLI